MTKEEQDILDWLNKTNLKDEFHLFIQRDDAYTRIVTGLGGWRWEEEFELLCNQKGLAYTAPKSKTSVYDGEANGLKVQCKATCLAKAFDIRCKKKKCNRRYEIGDFDVLALKVYSHGASQYFFIPSSTLVDPKNPTMLVGRIRLQDVVLYVDNWEIFTPAPTIVLDFKQPSMLLLEYKPNG